MADAQDKAPPAVIESARGIALLRFAASLFASADLAELEHKVMAGIGKLIYAPMYTLYFLDPRSGRPVRAAPLNVSETMLARYERIPQGRESDPLLARVMASRGAAYNMASMSTEEWLESPIYTHVVAMHDMRHIIQAPVVCRDEMIGTINLGTSEPDRGYNAGDVRLAEALGRVVGVAVEGIRAREDLEHELARARAALELTGSAVVVSDPGSPEVRLNDAARQLLAQLKDGEDRLYGLLAPTGEHRSAFSRHVDLALVDGEQGSLHAYSSRLPNDRGLVTLLELHRDQAGEPAGPLLTLTPREREVATLVADGLGDREIADRLYLSHHTVSQYVKRIYRKLGVGSRVALTRLLLERR